MHKNRNKFNADVDSPFQIYNYSLLILYRFSIKTNLATISLITSLKFTQNVDLSIEINWLKV